MSKYDYNRRKMNYKINKIRNLIFIIKKKKRNTLQNLLFTIMKYDARITKKKITEKKIMFNRKIEKVKDSATPMIWFLFSFVIISSVW